MTEESFKRKLTTILSADVAEYSRLMCEIAKIWRDMGSALDIRHLW